MSAPLIPSKIPLSDSWLTEVQSDESDSRGPEAFECGQKLKYSKESYDVCGNETDNSSNSTDDSDDADDEDWIASDHERKRLNRECTSTRYARYLPVSSRIDPHHRDRVKIRVTPNQHTTTAFTSRSLRPGIHSPKAAVTSASYTYDLHASDPQFYRRCSSSLRSPIDRILLEELEKPRQCLGPGCTKPATGLNTKYCSGKCGLQLAIRRLEAFLPENLPTLFSDEKRKNNAFLGNVDQNLRVNVAEQLDRTRLEEIQTQKCVLHDRLVQLELEHQQLSALVNQARQNRPKNNLSNSFNDASKDGDQAEQLEPVVCVTCASEVSMRHALRHMEKCFQKMEGNTVFCANQKEQIMGTPLFCDTYDAQAKAYCKRLRVVCEHFREPKLPPDSVCGFPLVRDVFIETGEYCCVPRNKCTSHLGWERLRRARIDIERYRCFIKMDELLQEEQRLHQSMSQRGGILGLLLHRTTDHNPSVQVVIPSKSGNQLYRRTTM